MWISWGGWSGRLGEESHRTGRARSIALAFLSWAELSSKISPWSFGQGVLSPGSSFVHNYLLLWEKYNPKLLKYCKLQKSDKSVSIGELRKSESTRGKNDGYK